MIPKKPVPGLDPGMEAGFRKRSRFSETAADYSGRITGDGPGVTIIISRGVGLAAAPVT
jgi:hypothetical protein